MDYVLSVQEAGSSYPSLWIDPAVPDSEARLIIVPDEARATGFVTGVVLDADGEHCKQAMVSLFQKILLLGQNQSRQIELLSPTPIHFFKTK